MSLRAHSNLCLIECTWIRFILRNFWSYISGLLQTDKRLMPLKEQLASVNPVLEDLRIRKEERIKQFSDIKAQIEKINGEISGCYHLNDAVANHINVDEHDLSLRKLNEYQTHLRSIQKEKVCMLIRVSSTPLLVIFHLYHILFCIHNWVVKHS